MLQSQPKFEIFVPETPDDYERAGELIFKAAELLDDPRRITYQGDSIAQWMHSNPKTNCRVSRHEHASGYAYFQLDVLSTNSNARALWINSWIFGKQVGLVPIVDRRLPLSHLDLDEAQLVGEVSEDMQQAIKRSMAYGLPTGTTRTKFVRELMSFTSNTASNRRA